MKENIEIIYSTIRHEICESIRKYLKYNNGQEWILMLDETISLNEVLDKIEKGENQ